MHILGVGVLAHLFARVEKTESRGLSGVHADELGKTLLDAVLGATLNEENVTLKVSSSIRELLVHVGVLFIGEEDKSFAAFAEDWLNVILRESDDSGDSTDFAPGVKLSTLGGAGVVDGALVEAAEDRDAGGGSSVLGSAVFVGLVELHVVVLASSLQEGAVHVAGFLTEVD